MRFILVDTWAEHGLIEHFGSHSVQQFNPVRYLGSAVYPTAEHIVNLHRRGDSGMKHMLDDCLSAVRKFGAQGLLAHQNYFPPEWLAAETQGLVRVLGCFDDPMKTYSATLPVVWAYHGAYYCSPSYSKSVLFRDALKAFGVNNTHWFPLSSTIPTDDLVEAVRLSWSRRRSRAVYVGRCYTGKVDRLATFDRGIGGQLDVYGKGWSLAGFGGFVAPLRGRRWFPKRVRSISASERREIYLTSLVALNMHLGDHEETGNMRMYEAPMHGALLLSDTAGCNAHADIFEPDVEAVYYRTIDEAVDKCLYYFEHPDRAIKIAQQGFERARRDYDPRNVMKNLLDWAATLNPAALQRDRAAAC